MKALAHRLRGRRASRRDGDGPDDVERSLRVDEADQDDRARRRDDAAAPVRHDDYRKVDRGLSSKTGSLNALAASAQQADATPKVLPQGRAASASNVTKAETQQKPLARAHSNSRVTSSTAAAAALKPNNRHQSHYHHSSNERAICMSGSSSSSSSSAGRRTRSRRGGSMSSNASFLSVSNQRPEAAVDVRHSGYLFIKRGLLKVADKRFYFVARRSPELYSCKDETSFSLWLASGHALDPHGGNSLAKASGLSPVLVGAVLRADVSSEDGGGHSDRMFSVVVGSASKCITLRLGAESGEKAAQWLEALREVQVTKRHEASRQPGKLASASNQRLLLPLNEHDALRAADSIGSSGNEQGHQSGASNGDVVLLLDETSEPVPTKPAQAKLPRVYAGGKLQSKPRVTEEDEATAVSTPTSHTGSSPTSASASTPVAAQSRSSSRLNRMDSCSSTASGQSQGSNPGNVLLFVPVAGSALTASASRMAKAQQELDALVSKGAKLPSRVMKEPANGDAIQWRYGAPEYVLTDLAYVKGRTREPDATPLASYVEECCQTFIMEATHKTRYDQWHSVRHDSFYLQVNDGERVRGSSILENDMLGLLYLGGLEASSGADQGDSDEGQDPRAELAEAFPDGFPMEVLDVFTQPPQCYFSWRHWGPFTGKFRGVKGDGSKVEVRGFGEMTVDASRMRSLRLFFKDKDLIAGLRQVTDRVTQARRDTATLSSMNAVPVRTARSTSAAVAPVTRKGSVPTARTSEIIEGLANFTIEAQEHQRKQSR
ncbi:hypothetical protein PR001_g13396 [Phytophthora rubi]|uniref:PH domain-containing protein n=1 Tax=Phytophthora rubi TaxID=129364 RepID=A0A6A3LPV4_9STRA|nr:hypothetical protein PR001_g13396 [Phytophthora rubi]